MISLHKNIKEQYGLEALKQLHLREKNQKDVNSCDLITIAKNTETTQYTVISNLDLVLALDTDLNLDLDLVPNLGIMSMCYAIQIHKSVHPCPWDK